MCIIQLNKGLIDLYYDYAKNDYAKQLKTLLTDTDSFICEIKTKTFMRIFVRIKKYFDFGKYLAKSKYSDDSNKLVLGTMKDAAGGVATEQFFGLKAQMYSFLVNNSSEPKKANGVNKNIVARISPNEY